MKAFVYKLRPSPAQAALFAETLETCRRLYNYALNQRKAAYIERGETLAFARQSASLPQLKQTWHHLKRVHSQVLQDVLHRLQHAFDGFFRRLKAGQTPGYPRFRGKDWYDSFSYRQWGNGATLERGRLVLSKIGAVRIVRDRALQGTPKTCTIVRKADGWYAHIACEVPVEPLPPTGKAVGVDVGLESFATLSSGTQIANPRLYRAAERKLKRAQRRLSRRVKGSNRRRKARELLAKAHLKVQRARLDFAHKTARCLVNEYDQIVVEKLNIKAMVCFHPLAKSISDSVPGSSASLTPSAIVAVEAPVPIVALPIACQFRSLTVRKQTTPARVSPFISQSAVAPVSLWRQRMSARWSPLKSPSWTICQRVSVTLSSAAERVSVAPFRSQSALAPVLAWRQRMSLSGRAPRRCPARPRPQCDGA